MEIGKSLKEAREARKLTLEAVEEESKIRCKYLLAMENEQFDILPDPVYARAFLKNYARFLNIDVGATMETYNQKYNQVKAMEVPDRPQKEKFKISVPGRRGYWLYCVAAVVVVILAFSVFHGIKGVWPNQSVKTGDVKNGEPGKAIPRTGEQAQAPAGQQIQGQQPAAGVTGVNLVLNVKKDRSWVQVVVDGSQEFQGLMPEGQTKNFVAKEKIAITLGNAGAVEVLLNGQSLGFLGGNGDVVNKEFTLQTRG